MRSFECALQLRSDLERTLKSIGLDTSLSDDEPEPLLRCIGTGFFGNIAQIQPNGSYRRARSGEILHLHPHSILNVKPPRWVIYNECLMSEKSLMKEVSEFEPAWALELAPHFYEDKRKSNQEKLFSKEIEKKVDYEQVFEKKEESVSEFLKKRIKGIKERVASKQVALSQAEKQRKNFKVSDDLDDF